MNTPGPRFERLTDTHSTGSTATDPGYVTNRNPIQRNVGVGA